jgi:tetratricopeptide (TPR) repeat protein
MGQALNREETIREYLLGRVSDEATLDGIEERLFTDEEFCLQVALAEDGIINDYVLGRLDHADRTSLQSTLARNPERRFKLELTQALRENALARNVKASEDKPSFFASLQSLWRQPRFVAAFAVLLIAVLASAIYFGKRNNPDDLAELRTIYRQERPTETRISEFGYAPLPQLRGAPEPGDRNRLRRIENNLSEAAEKAPNAHTHHALGVFYLTQQKYSDAIKELQAALRFADTAKIHNDLGAAQFELAKTQASEKRLEDLARSLEEFTSATKLDANFLEALFNKALALEELGMPGQAKESWILYLQKDPSSHWADEARQNLTRLEGKHSLFRKDDEVLSDFLVAYNHHDNAQAQSIHDETKGLLSSVTVPLQLSRRYLLAKRRGDEAEANESLEAMIFIGNFERTQHSEFFF